MSAHWTTSDAWVFSSIEGAGPDDGCTLVQPLMKAEGINHASLTEAELTQSVRRLTAVGLIGADAETDRYWHTATGHILYQKAMKRRGLFGWTDAIPPALRKLGEPHDDTWSLPAGAFDRATSEAQTHRNRLLKARNPRRRDPGNTA